MITASRAFDRKGGEGGSSARFSREDLVGEFRDHIFERETGMFGDHRDEDQLSPRDFKCQPSWLTKSRNPRGINVWASLHR